MLSDPIADMLTRIRNGLRSRKKRVTVNGSRVCRGICQVLQDEGFITSFSEEQAAPTGTHRVLNVELKYSQTGDTIIRGLVRVSKPGRRLYLKADEIPRVNNGLGIAILSTPAGIMSSRRASREHVGGEILCTVE